MKRPLSTLAGVLLWSVVTSSGCQMASHGNNVEGTRLHQAGNYQAAMDRFLRALAYDPNNPDGYYNLAATYHSRAKLSGDQNDYRQAENYYNQCLNHDNDHAPCYRGLAVLLTETGRPDAAIRLMDSWIQDNPANPEAKVELARLMEEFGNRDAATARLLEALALDPSNPRALTALGRLREQSGETVQALANYQRSLEVDQFQPQVASRVAMLQSSLGSSAIRHDPTNTRTVERMLGWQRY